MIIALFFVGCGTKKAVVTIMPCESETMDDSLYIRELGHGISANLQLARNMALHDAKFKMINRFCDSVRTYMPQVVYNSAVDTIYVGFKDSILFQYPSSYFGELSYTRKECEKVTYDGNNQYHCFITIALSKEDFRHADDKVILDIINFIATKTLQLHRDREFLNFPTDSITLEE